MTGSTTQVVLDAIDLWRGKQGEQASAIRARAGRTVRAILCFAAGCATAAILYVWIGLWGFALPVVIGAITAAAGRGVMSGGRRHDAHARLCLIEVLSSPKASVDKGSVGAWRSAS